MADLDFPYHFDGRGRTATTDRDDHIRDLIEQVLFTSPGERVMRPDFGAGLLQLVFEPNSTTLAATTQMLVQSALQLHLSHLIAVQAVEVEQRRRGAARRRAATPCCSTARQQQRRPSRRRGRRHEVPSAATCAASRSCSRSGSANGIDFLEVLDQAAPARGAAPADAVRAPAAARLHADAGQPAHRPAASASRTVDIVWCAAGQRPAAGGRARPGRHGRRSGAHAGGAHRQSPATSRPTRCASSPTPAATSRRPASTRGCRRSSSRSRSNARRLRLRRSRRSARRTSRAGPTSTTWPRTTRASAG